MPNIWTHIHFAEKVTKGLLPNDDRTRPFLRLGAQGPDPFFYHNFWPWKETPVSEVGQKIHYEHCGAFLKDMIDTGKITEDKRLKTYIIGFLTHHILDRTTHPFIIHFSGDEKNKHQVLETTIDTVLLKEEGIRTWSTPVYKQIDIGKQLYEPIEEMLERLIQKYFNEIHNAMPQGYISKSYRDMKRALRIMFDPKGWKNKLSKGYISPFSHQPIAEEKDYLNLGKSTWCHPVDESETYDKTFLELFEEAVITAKEMLPLVMKYWNGEEVESKLLAVLGNYSYDTGKDCTLECENRHFNPIV